MSTLNPCKKHGTMPHLKEIVPEPWENSKFPFHTIQKQYKYVCPACELEKEVARKQPLIDAWNKEQEE